MIVRAPYDPAGSSSVDSCAGLAVGVADRAPRQDLRRVLHVINGEHYSGAERVQDLLGMALPASGYSVGFVSLKPGRFASSRRSVDCPLYAMTMKSRVDWHCGREVARLIREQGYGLVHAHTPRSLWVAAQAARLADVPLVYHVHSPVGRDCGSWWKNRLNTWIESRLLNRCDHMLCVSGTLYDYMISLGHAAERMTVVRNGVPVRETRINQVPRDVWTVGTVALFRPRKGLEVLLQAMARLQANGLPVRLLAVGPFETPAYQREILSLVERLGIGNLIEWTGFQQDVDSRLRQMQMMVLPSLYGEGLPMVVLEAMAEGIPVVASRVEGVPEALRDGVDGWIVEPGNSDELADRIRQMMADPQEWLAMGTRARQHQQESLSDRAMAAQVAAVYDRLWQN